MSENILTFLNQSFRQPPEAQMFRNCDREKVHLQTIWMEAWLFRWLYTQPNKIEPRKLRNGSISKNSSIPASKSHNFVYEVRFDEGVVDLESHAGRTPSCKGQVKDTFLHILSSEEASPHLLIWNAPGTDQCLFLYLSNEGELMRYDPMDPPLVWLFRTLLGVPPTNVDGLAQMLADMKLIPQAEPVEFADEIDVRWWPCKLRPRYQTKPEEFPIVNEGGDILGIIIRHQVKHSDEQWFRLIIEACASLTPSPAGRDDPSVQRVPFLLGPCPMYRPRFVHYKPDESQTPPATVLLTDCLLTAKINWLEMEHGKRDSIEWVSWHTGKYWQSHTDFSCLNGKDVYYVLHEHSGLGSKQILGTADTVRKLIRDKVKSLSFVWFLPDRPASERPSGEGLNAPVLLSEEDFNRVKAKALAPASFTIQLPRPRAWLFPPLLRERSLTLIHGDREMARWFALSTAFSLAYGRWRLLPGWPTSQPNQEANVLYLATQHGNSDSLLERLQLILRMTGASYPENTPPITSLRPALFPSAFFNLQHLNQKSAKLFWLALKPEQLDPLKNPGMFQGILGYINTSAFADPARPDLIVIDGMPVKSPGGARDEQSRAFVNFLSQLQRCNCSLMVVARNSCSDKKLAGFRERFKPDIVGEITQCAAPWSRDLGALITFAKNPGLVDPSFAVHWELARNAEPPCWRLPVLPLSQPDRDLHIWQWHRQGYKAPHIVNMLHSLGLGPPSQKPIKEATVRQVLSRIKQANGKKSKSKFTKKAK